MRTKHVMHHRTDAASQRPMWLACMRSLIALALAVCVSAPPVAEEAPADSATAPVTVATAEQTAPSSSPTADPTNETNSDGEGDQTANETDTEQADPELEAEIIAAEEEAREWAKTVLAEVSVEDSSRGHWGHFYNYPVIHFQTGMFGVTCRPR